MSLAKAENPKCPPFTGAQLGRPGSPPNQRSSRCEVRRNHLRSFGVFSGPKYPHVMTPGNAWLLKDLKKLPVLSEYIVISTLW